MSPGSSYKYHLNKPESFFLWFAQIKDVVDEDLWLFFDPDSEDTYHPPVPVTVKDINPDANTFLDLTGPQRTTLHQDSSTYNSEFSRYQRYTKAKTKALAIIRETGRK